MKFKLSIALCLITFLGSINCYPDCIQPDLTCPLNVSNLALPPISRVSWEKCRDMCNKHTYCTSFTFYGPEGTPFKHMCFLFKEDCERSERVDCNCGSGFQCDFCSIRGIFSVNATNLSYLSTRMIFIVNKIGLLFSENSVNKNNNKNNKLFIS